PWEGVLRRCGRGACDARKRGIQFVLEHAARARPELADRWQQAHLREPINRGAAVSGAMLNFRQSHDAHLHDRCLFFHSLHLLLLPKPSRDTMACSAAIMVPRGLLKGTRD